MSKVNYRIQIPRSADEFLQLCQDVLDKHEADGENSILTGTDVEAFAGKVELFREKHEAARYHEREARRARRERNELFGIAKGLGIRAKGSLLWYVASIRDALVSRFKSSEYMLNQWGFRVRAGKSGEEEVPETGNGTD